MEEDDDSNGNRAFVHYINIQNGNLFDVSCNAIVNAANKSLQQGGGIDGLMRQYCGNQLTIELDSIKENLIGGTLTDGQACITSSYNHKKAEWVIHTAAPRILTRTKPTRTQECALRLCYFNSLKLTNEKNIRSVAFPILGTGHFNWPSKHAIAVALQGCLSYFEVHPLNCIENVYLVIKEEGPLWNQALELTTNVLSIPISSDTAALSERENLENRYGCCKQSIIPLPGTALKVGSFVKEWIGTERNQYGIKKMMQIITPPDLSLKWSDKTKSTPQHHRSGQFSNDKRTDTKGGRIISQRITSSEGELEKHLQVQRLEHTNARRIMKQGDKQQKMALNVRDRKRRQRLRQTFSQKEIDCTSQVSVSVNEKLSIGTVFLPEMMKDKGRSIILSYYENNRGPEEDVISWLLENVSDSRTALQLLNSESARAENLESSRPRIEILLDTFQLRHRLIFLDGLLSKFYNKYKIYLLKQLNARIISPENSTKEELAARSLCRIPYHVKSPNEDILGYSIIDSLFPEIHKEYIGFAAEATERNRTDQHDEKQCSVLSPCSTEFSVEKEMLTLPEDNKIRNSASMNDIVNEDDFEKYVGPEEEFPSAEIDDPEYTLKEENEKAVDEKIEEEIFGQHPDDDLNPVATSVLKRLTYIRKCDDRCPAMCLSDACAVSCCIRSICESDAEEVSMDMLLNLFSDDNNSDDMTFLKKYSPCYSGLRSVLNRLTDMRTIAIIRSNIRIGLGGDVSVARHISSLRGIPRNIQEIFGRTYKAFHRQTHHSEEHVMENFGPKIESFHESLLHNAVESCDLCNQLCLPSSIAMRSKERLENYMSKKQLDTDQEMFTVCSSCVKGLQKQQMPVAAEKNRMQLSELPAAFYNLNWIEKNLIQLIKPVQSLVSLRDIGGKKTAVRATSGAMVLLPVPLSNTIDHVADTLPSATSMKIHVSSSYGFAKVVDLRKILIALNWLRDNNIHYKDITINHDFQFKKNEEVVFEKEPEDDAKMDLILRTDIDDDYMLTQANVEVQPLKGVNPPQVPGLASEHYKLKTLRYQPLGIRSPNVEAKVFPWLYPTGSFHMDDPQRLRKVPLAAYIRARLLHKDGRFATDIKWIAYMFGLKMQMEIYGAMGTQGRISRNATADDLNKLLNNDLRFSSSINTIFAQLRGFGPYWKRVQLNVRAHVELFGNPTWFLTLNPAEYDWDEVLAMYTEFYPKATKSNLQQHIAMDPRHWCRYFDKRIRSFLKTMLSPGGPLGTVTHHFFRVEYQHRGTQHVHCLLWCKESPSLNASPAEITRYIDSIVTARLPDRDREPTLFQLVDKYQRHWEKHSKTCLRPYRVKGKTYSFCRFEFPRPTMAQTTLVKHNTTLAGIPGMSRKQYHLARTADDTMINDYNPAILLAWRGNIDIQFIMSDATDIVNYATGYVTKSEKSKGQPLAGLSVEQDDFDNRMMYKTFINLLKMKETGALEMVDILLSHKLYQFDCGHVFINTGEDASRNRLLIKAAVAENGGKGQAYEDNWLDTYYPGRPPNFDRFSLFNLMINFEVSSSGKNATGEDNDGGNSDEDNSDVDLNHLDHHEDVQHGLSIGDRNNPFLGEYAITNPLSPFFCHPTMKKGTSWPMAESGRLANKWMKKKKAVCPRTFFPNPDGTFEIEEDFNRRLCMLFIPWRDEGTLLGVFESYGDRFYDFMNGLETANTEAHADIMQFIKNTKKLKEGARERKNRWKMIKDAMNALKDSDVQDDVPFEGRVVDKEMLETNLNNMNLDQNTIFDKIMAHVEHQDTAKNSGSKIPQPIQVFVSGTAGTGKSFLIHNIADALTLLYSPEQTRDTRPAVLLAAPTGFAAINIKGATLHGLFHLEAQRGKNAEFLPMSFEKVAKSRAFFHNVRLVIIDEVSMCSSIMLTKLHLRMQEITGNEEDLFGGLNIMAFGDLLQLPPVQAPKVFKKLSAASTADLFKSIAPPVCLWSAFEYSELTKNMRQKDDLEFAEIMGRVRVQALTDADISKLKTRLIPTNEENGIPTVTETAEYYLNILKNDPTCLALFSTNDEVLEFNNAVMDAREMDTFVVEAEESLEYSAREETIGNTSRPKLSRPYQKREFSIVNVGKGHRKLKAHDPTGRKCGGLAKSLVLAVGARVMLRRNLDVANGLVNGSTGYLEDTVTTSDGEIVALMIKFDRCTRLTKVEKVSAVYDVSRDERRRRRQFPVSVAFAATVHKCQGLTVKHAVVSMRSMFAPGQAFVAMSRVQNIQGLHLTEFLPKKVVVDGASLLEYNRLRATVNLPQFPMPAAKKDNVAEKQEKSPLPKKGAKRGISSVDLMALSSPKKKMKLPPELEIKPQRKPRFHVSKKVRQFPGLLQLSNSGSDCFLISLVNVINAMPHMKDALIASPDHLNLAMQYLSSVLDKTYDDVVLLRRQLPPELHRGHQDVRDVWPILAEMMPSEIKNMFEITVHSSHGCESCGTVANRTDDLPHIGFKPTRNGESLLTLANVFRNVKKTCRHCQSVTVHRKQFTFARENRYLLVSLNHANAENPKDVAIPAAAGIDLFGARWNLRAMCEYSGDGQAGHYKAWVRLERSGFAVLDDDKPISVTPAITTLRHFNFLLLERCQVQPEFMASEEEFSSEYDTE